MTKYTVLLAMMGLISPAMAWDSSKHTQAIQDIPMDYSMPAPRLPIYVPPCLLCGQNEWPSLEDKIDDLEKKVMELEDNE